MPRVLAGAAALSIATLAALATLVVIGGAANACQPEYCPPQPLLCEWGPFAGTCVYPY